MKKNTLLALTFTLLFSLCACGGGETAGDTTAAAATAAAQTTAAVEETTAKQEAAAPKQEKPGKTDENKSTETKPAADQQSTDKRPSGEEKEPLVKQEGDIVELGSFDGLTLEWLALEIDEENERALLAAKDIVAYWAYSTNQQDGSTWENSDIRAWLNDTFYNQAFTDEQKAFILESEIANPPNPESGIGGENTIDKLFLLSYEEAQQYFPTSESRQAYCNFTPEYAKILAKRVVAASELGYTDNDLEGLETDFNSYSGTTDSYWLRTPGTSLHNASGVSYEGELEVHRNQIHSLQGIRPAVWVHLFNDADLALLTAQANEIAAGFGTCNDEPMVWQVLDIDTEKQTALLISKDCIDVMEMDYADNEDYAWYNSNLCYWLNYEFRIFNFTQLERNKILETVQENPANSETGVSSGEPTDEWLFVLSMDEANKYFKEDADRVASYNGEPQGWWLRTAGGETGWYAIVKHDDSGQIDPNGRNEADSYGVRPACWVQLPGENPLLTTKVDANKVDAPLNPKAMLDDDVPEYYIDFTDEIVLSYDVTLYNQALLEQLQSGNLRIQVDWSINSQEDWKCTGEDDWPDWLGSDYGSWADGYWLDDGDTATLSVLRSNYDAPKENHYEEICYGITENGEGFLNLTDNTIYFRLRFVAAPETGDVYSPWSEVFAIGKDANQ